MIECRISCTCPHVTWLGLEHDHMLLHVINSWSLIQSCSHECLYCVMCTAQYNIHIYTYICYIYAHTNVYYTIYTYIYIICCVAVIVWDSKSHAGHAWWKHQHQGLDAPDSATAVHTPWPVIPTLWSSAINSHDIYTDTSSLPSLWVCPIPAASTWLLWGRRISQQVFPQCHQCLVAMRDAILHRRSHFCIPAQRNRTEPFGIILKISVWL